MKSINYFINERLKINKDSKVNNNNNIWDKVKYTSIDDFYNKHKNLCFDRPEYNGIGKCTLTISNYLFVAKFKDTWNKYSHLINDLLSDTIKFEKLEKEYSKMALIIYNNDERSGEIYIDGRDRKYTLDYVINIISPQEEDKITKIALYILEEILDSLN